LRSSIAASETLSSARVSPRSVISVAAISATTSVERDRGGAHRAGARHVAHGAVAHAFVERLLAVDELHERRDRVEHPVAAEDLALVGEVDRRHLEALGGDVLPHVELGPVREREDAHVLAAADAPVVEVPQLGALGLGSQPPKSSRNDMIRSFARRPLLVAARAAERASKPCSAIASSSVVVCRRLRDARGPVSSTTRPRRSSPARWPRSAARRARPRGGRGTR
jgi:hypothetical protein